MNFNIVKFFTQGNERSKKAKFNILVSFILKGIGIAINLLLVPLTLNYLNPTNYGIWITLSSIIAWIVFFDIGLGNGLRNKFAEALAKNDKDIARVFVSTSYTILSIIVFLVYFAFLFINPYLNWSKILNTSLGMEQELGKLVMFVFTFFCMQLILKLVSSVIIADQKPAVADLLNVLCNVLSLIFIFFLIKTTSGSLLYLGISLSLAPVIIYFLASIFFFTATYKAYRPSFKFIKIKYVKELTALGFQFFFIQISGIILYSTSNIIITQFLGPAEVTPYNIAYRYFYSIIMIFTIVLTPFWSAFTEAFHKGDFMWIRNVMKKLTYFRLALIFVVILMITLANIAYRIWIGDKVKVPFLLSVLMAVFVIITLWNMVYIYFINGVGKIRLQLYIGILSALIHIPLSIYFVKYLNLGSSGVVLSTCLCISPTIILWPIQFRKIINKQSRGIWDK